MAVPRRGFGLFVREVEPGWAWISEQGKSSNLADERELEGVFD
jgi:hypothetical protein